MGVGFRIMGDGSHPLILSSFLFSLNKENQNPFSYWSFPTIFGAEFFEFWSTQTVEKSLGVIEHPLGVIFMQGIRFC